MKSSITTIRQHQNLSRRISPNLAFTPILPTSAQSRTHPPGLLQLRPSSSSGDRDAEFDRLLRRLITAQRTLDKLEATHGSIAPTWQTIQRLKQLTVEERVLHQERLLAQEKERLKVMANLVKIESDRRPATDLTKDLKGRGKVDKMIQLTQERAAEPRHRLSPQELQTVKTAFSVLVKAGRVSGTVARTAGWALALGFAYWYFGP